MHDSKSYCTRKMAASQSQTVHSKTPRVSSIQTRNLGPIGPIASNIPSPWIESLHKGMSDMPCMIQGATAPEKRLRPNHVRYIQDPQGLSYPHKKYWIHQSIIQYYTTTLNRVLTPKGRSHMLCMIQRATVPGKWLRPNHVRYIPRPTGSVLSTQELLDPSVHYPVLYHHLISSPYPKGRSDMLYQENGCVPITNSLFQDPQGQSCPHKKYWTHQSIVQYYTTTLNRVLTQRQIWYAMHDSKSYCTTKIAASESRTVHSKTHRVCPIHTRNIGLIGPLSSSIPSPWIESLPKGRSDMPCMIQRTTVPGKWLRPNLIRYIRRPTGSVLSTQEILDPSVHYPVLYHHLESSPYAKAELICHAWFKELLYQGNGCVPITYGTFQDPQGLSYPHKKYWTHLSIIQYYTITLNRVLTQRQVWYAMHDSELLYQQNGCVPITCGTFEDPQGLSYPHNNYCTHRSIIQYYTIALNRVLTQRQVWYAMHDSRSYCTRKTASSQSCTLHSRPTGSVLSTQEQLDPSVHYPVLYHHLESSPYPKADLICNAWFKELLYQENGCVQITNGTFEDPQGLSYPHKKSWTHWSNNQYYTITLNRVLTQRQVSYAMHDSKSYCTRKMADSQSRTVHSKTHRVCPIHTRNIGPIGPIASTIPSPWIESLPKGRSDMPCMIQRATVPG